MSKTNPAKVKSEKGKGKNMKSLLFYFLLLTFAFTTACRYDMQDQPRYKAYKKSDFFADGRSSRDFPAGTVARGNLRSDHALFTGKKENADPNATVTTTTDASGNTLVTSFPNDIEEFPLPVTKEMLDRGQQRFDVFCGVCHGPLGSGDGMVVRRGFPKPPTYHDDRLRNAPVGHFFDVITNGQGRMASYASQIPVADRWAIVMYIRALQRSQNPKEMNPLAPKESTNETPKPAGSPKASTEGGAK